MHDLPTNTFLAIARYSSRGLTGREGFLRYFLASWLDRRKLEKMQRLRDFWYDALDFTKTYLLCVRDIYKPLSSTNCPGRPLPIAFFAPGDTLNLFIWSIHSMELDGDHKFEYRFKYNETQMRSHDQESTTQIAFCCGCRKDTNDVSDYPRPIIYKSIPNKEGETPLHLALKTMEEIRKKQDVGSYIITQNYQQIKDDYDAMVPIIKVELEKICPEVPFLILRATQGNYEPYVDYISYEHLALRVDKDGGQVTITDKMVACGFLSINAVIKNPEKLNEFEGFGLIIGQASENGFGIDRFCEEIEKSLNNDSSSFECFGLFDKTVDWKSEEIMARLKSYSPSCETYNPGDLGITALEFNDEKDSAIVFRENEGVCFVRNGRKKWYGVIDQILVTLNQ